MQGDRWWVTAGHHRQPATEIFIKNFYGTGQVIHVYSVICNEGDCGVLVYSQPTEPLGGSQDTPGRSVVGDLKPGHWMSVQPSPSPPACSVSCAHFLFYKVRFRSGEDQSVKNYQVS